MHSPRRLLLLAASSLALLSAAALPAPATALAPAAVVQTAEASQPWAHAASDIPADTAVRFGVLPNGMRYAIMKNATPPGQASLRLRIAAGSLMETDQQLGLAHFMEHMAFNGTTNVPENELLRVLERLGLAFGADTNAFTSFDQTAYLLELPRTNDETVDTALHIMREQVSEALMKAEDIDAERGVIEGEERSRNTPALRSLKAQLALLAPGQLLSQRLPIGDLSIIRTAPRERFVEFYNSYYRPERATLIAVGDFDVDQMEAKIKANFSSWQAKGTDGQEPDLGKVAPREPDTRILVEPGVQSSIQLTWIRDPDLRPDTVALRTEDTLQSLGLAVLNRRLGEIARADNPPFIGAGASEATLFKSLDMGSIVASFNPGGLKRALETLDQEQRRLIQYGVSQAELDREIANGRTALQNAVAAASTRNTPTLANSLLGTVNEHTVFTAPETRLAMFEQAVADLTAETVSEAVKEAFEGYGPLVLVNTPEAIEGGEDGVTQILNDSRQVPVSAPAQQAELDWPYAEFGTPGTVATRTTVEPIDATVVTFPNNVRLVVKPTDFKKEEILITVRTGTGEQGLPADRFSPVSLASSVLTRGGLGKLTSDEMNRVLTGKIYSVGFGIDSDAYQLSGATRPEDLQLQLQVLAAYLTDPGVRPAPFEMIKAMFPQIVAQQMATPAGAFSLQASGLLASGDRREGLPNAEEIANASNDEMKRDLVEGLSTGPIDIVMVGDVTVDAAIKAVASTFGALPPRPATAPALPGSDQKRFPAPTAQPIELTHTGQADQGLAYIAWPTTDSVGDRTESRRIALLKEVVQLRVTEEIREKQAIAYSPGVAASSSDFYKGYGSLSIRADISPDKFDAFYAAVDSIVEGLKSAPPTEDELNRARLPVIEQIRRSQAGNTYWLAQLEDLAAEPQTLEQIQTQISDLEAVTPADIQQLAQQYLKPDTAWKAVVRSAGTPSS